MSGDEPWRAGEGLWRAGRAWEAHEAWEQAWRARRGSDSGEALRALIQLAAACVHLERGNERGFRSLARAAGLRLERLGARGVPSAMGLDLARLAAACAAFAAAERPRPADRPPIAAADPAGRAPAPRPGAGSAAPGLGDGPPSR